MGQNICVRSHPEPTPLGKNVNIITHTGLEKRINHSPSGKKMMPVLIFKRKTLPKETFPSDVVIRYNKKGWNNEDLMIDWFSEVWRKEKKKGAFFQTSRMLIMNSMVAHLTDLVSEMARKCAASLAIIPVGLTKKLQPLDLKDVQWTTLLH